jgi:dTDP-4-dehydrorhamnose reductase
VVNLSPATARQSYSYSKETTVALVDRGHEVTASTHRTENFSVIEALGARPALMDGLDDAAVRQAILETEPEVIINQITALSAPPATPRPSLSWA